MNTHHGFSPAQMDELRTHGIELFAGRVIFDAQPPMAEADIAAVQAQCRGPLPPGLLALWRQTAGGRLAYDLDVAMRTANGERIEAISWAELFYEGSERYHDLWGWIEHEQQQVFELTEEAGRGHDGKLDYLPIGGFEYCDRIYVVTTPGAPDCGGVLAWKMGLPPAWAPAMTEDAVATFAPSLQAAFAQLALHQDPLAAHDDYHPCVELLEYLDERREHGLPAELADALLAFYRRAYIDWPGLLQAGTLATHPRALRLALAHAVECDDTDLLRRIAAAGCPLDGLVRGGDDALAHARFLNKPAAAETLAALTRPG